MPRRTARAALLPFPVKSVKTFKYSQRWLPAPLATFTSCANLRVYCNAPSIVMGADTPGSEVATNQPMFWDQFAVAGYHTCSVLSSHVKFEIAQTETLQTIFAVLYRTDLGINPPVPDTSIDVEAVHQRPGAQRAFTSSQKPMCSLSASWSCRDLDRGDNQTPTITGTIDGYRPAKPSQWRLFLGTVSGQPLNASGPLVTVTVYYKCMLTNRREFAPS